MNKINRRERETNEMCIEALEEMLIAIDFCLGYQKKNDPLKWSVNINDIERGVLGLPAAALMFCIVDTIGSMYIDKVLEFNVDGTKKKEKKINEKRIRSFFWILNSDYFNLNLSEDDISTIYNLRSRLLHNSYILKKTILSLDSGKPFIEKRGDEVFFIHLISFLDACRSAVSKFKERISDLEPKLVYNEPSININENYPTT